MVFHDLGMKNVEEVSDLVTGLDALRLGKLVLEEGNILLTAEVTQISAGSREDMVEVLVCMVDLEEHHCWKVHGEKMYEELDHTD